jgi:hypothetical protein
LEVPSRPFPLSSTLRPNFARASFRVKPGILASASLWHNELSAISGSDS